VAARTKLDAMGLATSAVISLGLRQITSQITWRNVTYKYRRRYEWNINKSRSEYTAKSTRETRTVQLHVRSLTEQNDKYDVWYTTHWWVGYYIWYSEKWVLSLLYQMHQGTVYLLIWHY